LTEHLPVNIYINTYTQSDLKYDDTVAANTSQLLTIIIDSQ